MLCLGTICFSISFVLASTAEESFWPSAWREFTSHYICPDYELRKGLCLASNESQYCYCDSDCNQYGDCCIDAIDKSSPKKVSKWSVMQISAGKHFYARASCPESWMDYQTKADCETIRGRSTYSDTPYYSKRTGIYYANVYCAYCNNDFHDNELMMQVLCPTQGVGLIDYLEYDNRLKSFVYNGKGRSKVQCFVHLMKRASSKIGNARGRAGGATCTRYVTACKSTWPDDEVRRLCNTYKFKVYSKLGNAYKNYHCSLCNYVNPTQLTCLPRSGARMVSSSCVPFYLKISMTEMASSRIEGFQSDSSGHSSDGDFLKPFLGKLVSVECPSGYRWRDNRCRRKYLENDITQLLG